MAKLDGSEQVLAVRTEELARIGSWQGYYPCRPIQGGHWQRILLEHADFLPRTEDLEHGVAGLAWKQLIPYALLVHNRSLFCFRRPAAGGDSRLAGRLSIGLGGHVNPIDGRSEPATTDRLGRTLGAGLRRELREEVGVLSSDPRMVGLLLDEGNDVGRRHLGLVYTCQVQPTDVRPHSAEIEAVDWLTPAELRRLPADEWETWSALLVDGIDQVLRAPLAVGER